MITFAASQHVRKVGGLIGIHSFAPTKAVSVSPIHFVHPPLLVYSPSPCSCALRSSSMVASTAVFLFTEGFLSLLPS